MGTLEFLMTIIPLLLQLIVRLAILLSPVLIPLIICVVYYRKSKKEIKEKQELEQRKLQEKQERERKRRELEELKKIVTHYCPNCGALISSRVKKFSFCTICGTKLKDATGEITLTSTLFKDEELSEELKEDAKKSYSEALKNYDMGNYQQFVIKNNRAVELGYSPAIYVLGYAHYHAKGVSKNNVLAQKYMEEAAVIGYGLAYRYSTELRVEGSLRWSKVVENEEEGYFRAAVRGDLKALNHVISKMGGIRKENQIKDSDINSPTVDNQRLWWAVRVAEKGHINGIKLIYELCESILLKLSEFKGDKEVDRLITHYKEMVEFWKDKELHMKYPDEDCYNAYIAEQNGEYERALELYEKAAERNDQKAIEGYRRLSGDQNYKKVSKVVVPKNVVTLEQVLRPVTHYCPACGLLLSSKESQVEKCPLCEENLLESEMDQDFTTMELFPKPYGSAISRDEIRYYVRYPELSEAERKGDYEYISNYAKKYPEDGVAQYVLACMYEKEGNHEKYFEQLGIATELGSSEAAHKLGILYYEGQGCAEKDNVLAQKYMEIAASLGCGKAYDFIVQRCMSGEFRWSQIVKNEEDGLFKAAVRGVGIAGFKVCQAYNGNRKNQVPTGLQSNMPFEMSSKLWWMIRMARQGELEAVSYIKEYCMGLMKILVQYKNSNEASDLYREYEQILKYWTEKELILKYPNPICYQGVLAEQNGDFVMAREFYKMAAEQDDDEQAKELFRRLTGNKHFLLDELKDYEVRIEKAESNLRKGDYEASVMMARKALELYLHELFLEKQEELPEETNLNTLVRSAYERQIVENDIYNAMEFVRRKGNFGTHDSEMPDKEIAHRVMEALSQIIPNRQ